MLMKVIKTLIVKTTRLLRAKTLSTLTSGEVVMRVRTQNRTKMKVKMIWIEKKNGERKRLHLLQKIKRTGQKIPHKLKTKIWESKSLRKGDQNVMQTGLLIQNLSRSELRPKLTLMMTKGRPNEQKSKRPSRLEVPWPIANFYLSQRSRQAGRIYCRSKL